MAYTHTDWTAIVAGICAMGAASQAASAAGTFTGETQQNTVRQDWWGSTYTNVPPAIESNVTSNTLNSAYSSSQSLAYYPRNEQGGAIVTTSGVSFKQAFASVYRDLVGMVGNTFTSVQMSTFTKLNQGVVGFDSTPTRPGALALGIFEFYIDQPQAFVLSLSTSIYSVAPPIQMSSTVGMTLWRTDIPNGQYGPGVVTSLGDSWQTGEWNNRIISVYGILQPGPYALQLSTSIVTYSSAGDYAWTTNWHDIYASGYAVLTIPAPTFGLLPCAALILAIRRRR